MSDIEWKEGAVCYAGGKQWFFNDSVKPYKLVCNMYGTFLETLEGVSSLDDFQLNEPRIGDYLPKSELDTEQKYNDAVEVFGLFGFKLYSLSDGFEGFDYHDKLAVSDGCVLNSIDDEVRELNYNQLMAIGKLKRLMNERAISGDDEIHDLITKGDLTGAAIALNNLNKKSVKDEVTKLKQAYEILKSLDYEYDLVKQCWYRKEYIK